MRRQDTGILHSHGKTTLALGAICVAVAVPTAAHAASSNKPAPAPTPTCTGPAPQTLTGTGKNDRGPGPAVINIHAETGRNTNFRDTLWTGDNLQLTVMSINPGDDIGLEMHPALDQFIRIESGNGVAKMGPGQHELTLTTRVNSNSAVLIPAGTWHNVVNTGKQALKVYSIYAPPNHPRATLHRTKVDAKNDPLEKIKCPQDFEAE